MRDLTAHISRQVEAQAENCRASLAASSPRIDQAESLAEKIQTQGIQALAYGEAQGPHIHLWVTAGPATPARMAAALAQLGLVEIDRFPGHSEYEIRLQGYDIPLYVMTPLPAVAAP
jgi:hypothetical protein